MSKEKKEHGFFTNCAVNTGILLVTVLISGSIGYPLLSLITAAFTSGTADPNIHNLVTGLLCLLLECAIVFFVYKFKTYNDKYLTAKVLLRTFPIPFAIQFVVAFFNHFYVYTAGPSATVLGTYLYFLITPGDYELTTLNVIPSWCFIVTLVITDACILASIVLAARLSGKRRKKERDELLAGSGH